MNGIYAFSANDINGQTISLADFAGKVLLIVNTASRCGFTPQYRELESLYRKLQNQGFEVLAFPCNQFGRQEPGSNRQIAEFCQTSFQTSFPLFAKIDVNGEQAHPLFRYLKSAAPGALGSQAIKWNFSKFLIDQRGQVVKRYASITSPKAIQADIERLLNTN